MSRKSARTWLAMLLLSSAGCNAIQDHCVTFETNARNTVLAEKGWLNWSSCYDDVNYKFHFAKGFKEGYTNILEGGKGCQPTLPPRWYWKPCYQTPEGRNKIHAWFDGYSHGAVAAEQDGFGNLQQLPISPTAKANLLTRQAPASAACFAGMSQEEDMDAEPRPDIHGGNIPEEPPVEMLDMPEVVDPPADAPKPDAVKPYDEGAQPAAP